MEGSRCGAPVMCPMPEATCSTLTEPGVSKSYADSSDTTFE